MAKTTGSRNHVRYLLECVACHEIFVAKRKDAQTCKMSCRQQKNRKGIPWRGITKPPIAQKPKGQKETWVYRAYNVAGNLLYVGITNTPKERMLAHRQNSVWWEDKANMTWERFTSRSAAEDSELLAIRTEFPVFNIIGKES